MKSIIFKDEKSGGKLKIVKSKLKEFVMAEISLDGFGFEVPIRKIDLNEFLGDMR